MPFRHAGTFCYFDLRDVNPFEIRCVCHTLGIIFIYLDLEDISIRF